MSVVKNAMLCTSLAVGSPDLDGSQVVEKLLEFCVLQLWCPGRDWCVMKPVKDNMRISGNVLALSFSVYGTL